MTSAASILDPQAVAGLYAQGAAARGLPGRAYTDPAFLAVENERLFPRGWAAAGVASDIPNPGDAMPVTVADVPLVLVRDREGAVRALVNICRHRGMRVVGELCAGQASLRCPYHQWTYDLDGRLVATPNLGGFGRPAEDGFDRAELGLKPVRSGVWLNTIFVNLDGKAPPLAEHVAPFERFFADYDLGLLRHGGTRDRWVDCNWKLFLEGGIEDYHLPWVHPQFFTQPVTWSTRTVADGAMVGTESRFPGASVNPAGSNATLPRFPGLKAEHLEVGNFMVLFPNVGIAVGADHLAVSLYQPIRVDRTYYRKDVYFVGEGATDPAFAPSREAMFKGWVEINDQDQALMEALQANHGVRDRLDIANRLAPAWEGAIQRFQQLVVEGMAA